MTASITIWRTRCSKLWPFKIIPLQISKKYVNGMTYDMDRIISGIAATGKKNPDSIIDGRNTKDDIYIACCCILAMVDIKRPKPSVDARKRNARTFIHILTKRYVKITQ